MAPMCFLGELWEIKQHRELTVLILGPELARDLDAAPALRQGSFIYLRTEPLAFYLWDNLSDPTKQNNIWIVSELGVSMAAMARRLNISTVAISKSVARGPAMAKRDGLDLA